MKFSAGGVASGMLLVRQAMWRPLIALVFSGLFGSGCCHLPVSSHLAKRPPLPAEVAADFAIPSPKQFTCHEKEVETNSHYSVKRVDLTIAFPGQTNRSLVLDYFIPH